MVSLRWHHGHELFSGRCEHLPFSAEISTAAHYYTTTPAATGQQGMKVVHEGYEWRDHYAVYVPQSASTKRCSRLLIHRRDDTTEPYAALALRS